MRPIFLGAILFVVGLIGWFVSVILTVITLGAFKGVANIFGLIFLWSLPVAALTEFIFWIIKKWRK